jgi:hypothetical protein
MIFKRAEQMQEAGYGMTQVLENRLSYLQRVIETPTTCQIAITATELVVM